MSSATGRAYGMDETSRVLQFSNYVFDVNITEIFTTLVFGGVVCVPTDAERLSSLADFMNKTRVNSAMLTPSFANTLRPEKCRICGYSCLVVRPRRRRS